MASVRNELWKIDGGDQGDERGQQERKESQRRREDVRSGCGRVVGISEIVGQPGGGGFPAHPSSVIPADRERKTCCNETSLAQRQDSRDKNRYVASLYNLKPLIRDGRLHSSRADALELFHVYERGTNVEQFVTRFLLKESANQIQSLLSSVESAVDAIDEQHGQSGHQPAKVSPRMPEKRYQNTVPDYPPNNRVSAREAVRTINTASGAVEVRKEGLEAQINRLAELIGRLENKTVSFDLHQRLTDTDGTPSAVTHGVCLWPQIFYLQEAIVIITYCAFARSSPATYSFPLAAGKL
ncbi:hypothetical protein CCH79_00010101 [Gambusia affinis]|uniref:Uncharacterized protein n=1 Tax=Gambusia affinis TaxID=33528 RepID=A0A315VRB9_GAMAF|nr:hypothetical protein CCH79_00010101 [Gambusia affinis]